MNEVSSTHREKLMTDLRTVISDAEEVLKVTADQATAGAAELRVRMQERLTQAKHRLHDLQENAVARAKAAESPVQRMVTPKDIARACLFYASPFFNDYQTGGMLRVDGGEYVRASLMKAS